MTEKRRTNIDLIAVVGLIVILVAGAFLASRSSRERAAAAVAVATGSVPTGRRIFDPALLRYREVKSVTPEESRLRGLAVGPDDHLFVSAGFAVIEYDRDGSEARRFELTTAARCLAVSVDGTKLFLGAGDRIEVLTLNDGERTSWPVLAEDAFVSSVAAGSEGVLVGDTGNRKLWGLDLDGNVVFEIGWVAPEEVKAAPSTYFDVAAAPDGTFWATDAGRHGLVQYSSKGEKLARWGDQGAAIEKFGGCCNPTHIAVCADDRIITVEKKPDLVKIYRNNGELDGVVAGPKAFVLKTFVADAAVDSAGRVYLIDPKQKSVRVFEPKDRAGASDPPA